LNVTEKGSAISVALVFESVLAERLLKLYVIVDGVAQPL